MDTWQVLLWTELMVLQVGTLAVLCGILRIRGFRLWKLTPGGTSSEEESSERPVLQFGMRHVLIWTTSLAMVLGLAKSLDVLNMQSAQQIIRAGYVWKLTVATASAMVIIVALWVALGRGHWFMRYSVGLAFTVLVATGLAMWNAYSAITTRQNFGPRYLASNWDLMNWLGWMFLSGGLLAATLIILRTMDYRLVRRVAR